MTLIIRRRLGNAFGRSVVERFSLVSGALPDGRGDWLKETDRKIKTLTSFDIASRYSVNISYVSFLTINL